jgi:hypothetical protein
LELLILRKTVFKYYDVDAAAIAANIMALKSSCTSHCTGVTICSRWDLDHGFYDWKLLALSRNYSRYLTALGYLFKTQEIINLDVAAVIVVRKLV